MINKLYILNNQNTNKHIIKDDIFIGKNIFGYNKVKKKNFT